jgi:hypothetical protein
VSQIRIRPSSLPSDRIPNCGPAAIRDGLLLPTEGRLRPEVAEAAARRAALLSASVPNSDGPAPRATIVPAAVERPATASAAKTSRLTTYAAGRFRLAGGQTRTIKVPLNPKGRNLARAPSAASVWANVTFTGKPAQTISAEITLSR